jgi:hypothetical protein
MVTAPDHVAVNEYALLVTRHRYTLSLAAATHTVLQAHLTAAAMLPIAALMNMRLHITVQDRAPRPYFAVAVCTPVDTLPPGAGPTAAAALTARQRAPLADVRWAALPSGPVAAARAAAAAAAATKRRRTADDDSSMDVVGGASSGGVSGAAAASPENLKHLLQSPWYQNYLEKVRATITATTAATASVVVSSCSCW